MASSNYIKKSVAPTSNISNQQQALKEQELFAGKTLAILEAFGYTNRVGPLCMDIEFGRHEEFQNLLHSVIPERVDVLVRGQSRRQGFIGFPEQPSYEENLAQVFNSIGVSCDEWGDYLEVLIAGGVSGAFADGAVVLSPTSIHFAGVSLLGGGSYQVFLSQSIGYAEIKDVETTSLVRPDSLAVLMGQTIPDAAYVLGAVPISRNWSLGEDSYSLADRITMKDPLQVVKVPKLGKGVLSFLRRRQSDADLYAILQSDGLNLAGFNWFGLDGSSDKRYPLVAALGLRIRLTNGSDLFVESVYDTIELLERELKERVSGAITSAAAPTTKICPWCAEEIKLEARLCRFCKQSLEAGPSSDPADVQQGS